MLAFLSIGPALSGRAFPVIKKSDSSGSRIVSLSCTKRLHPASSVAHDHHHHHPAGDHAGVHPYRTTDSNGVARLDINLRPGEYILTVQDSTGLMRSALVTVLPTLTGEDVVMDFMDGSTYDVAVVDGQGKPLVNETVTMNINGVFYNKVTDENGIASLDINLRPGEYIITTTHENATISNKITVKEA